jgi:hypothetical protein
LPSQWRCRFAEDVAIVVPLGLKRVGGALVGHHPVVIGLFGIVGAQLSRSATCVKIRSGFFSLVSISFIAGVVLPGTERILRFFGRVVVLLIDERSRNR